MGAVRCNFLWKPSLWHKPHSDGICGFPWYDASSIKWIALTLMQIFILTEVIAWVSEIAGSECPRDYVSHLPRWNSKEQNLSQIPTWLIYKRRNRHCDTRLWWENHNIQMPNLTCQWANKPIWPTHGSHDSIVRLCSLMIDRSRWPYTYSFNRSCVILQQLHGWDWHVILSPTQG